VNRSVAQVAQQLKELVLELVYPPRCKACERVGTYFCGGCLTRIIPLTVPRCPRCDRPLDDQNPLRPIGCADCWRKFPSLNGLRVLGIHQTPLREAIHVLKYDGFPAVARPLGEQLAAEWRVRGAMVDGVIPVPLHPERIAKRGYNQSTLLANALCNTLELSLYDNLIQRTRPTRPQVGLTHAERLQNVADAFAADPLVSGKRWLLVDDVCTTGATLEGCAAALRAAGAIQVWAVVLARPIRDDPSA
jgi:ComF family protein